MQVKRLNLFFLLPLVIAGVIFFDIRQTRAGDTCNCESDASSWTRGFSCTDDSSCDSECTASTPAGQTFVSATCVTVGGGVITPTPSGDDRGGGTSPTPPSTPQPTAAPPPTQCDVINPDCTAAWDHGEKTSRFISNRDCYCCGDCGFNDIVNIFINAADYLFGILGSLALLFFIYGGVIWLTAGGSAGQIDKGKKILLGAIIGMLLSLGAWMIVKFLVTALGVTPGVVTGF